MADNGICNMFITRPDLQRRRETEKDEEENNWRRIIFRQQSRRRVPLTNLLNLESVICESISAKVLFCDKGRV